MAFPAHTMAPCPMEATGASPTLGWRPRHEYMNETDKHEALHGYCASISDVRIGWSASFFAGDAITGRCPHRGVAGERCALYRRGSSGSWKGNWRAARTSWGHSLEPRKL